MRTIIVIIITIIGMVGAYMIGYDTGGQEGLEQGFENSIRFIKKYGLTKFMDVTIDYLKEKGKDVGK